MLDVSWRPRKVVGRLFKIVANRKQLIVLSLALNTVRHFHSIDIGSCTAKVKTRTIQRRGGTMRGPPSSPTTQGTRTTRFANKIHSISNMRCFHDLQLLLVKCKTERQTVTYSTSVLSSTASCTVILLRHRLPGGVSLLPQRDDSQTLCFWLRQSRSNLRQKHASVLRTEGRKL